MSRILRDIETLKLKVQILQEAQEVNLTANLALANEELSNAATRDDVQSSQGSLAESIPGEDNTPTLVPPEIPGEPADTVDSDSEDDTNEESDDHELLALAEIQGRYRQPTPSKTRPQNRPEDNSKHKTKKGTYAQA